MPPKPKFSREEIVDAALDIVSREGVSALTARELGEKLGIFFGKLFVVGTADAGLGYVLEAALVGFGEDFLFLAEESDVGNGVGDDFIGGLQCAGFCRFRENEALGMFLCLRGETFKQCHDILI